TVKIDELDRSNSDLRNLYESTQIATVFLDRDMIIRSFTPAVTHIFNLIPRDRGRPLTDIVPHPNYAPPPTSITPSAPRTFNRSAGRASRSSGASAGATARRATSCAHCPTR